MENYKCHKCGNKEEFTLRSFVEIEQDCYQDKKLNDYSSFNHLDQHYTRDVICKKCGAVIIENEHQIVNRNEIKPHIEDGLRSLRGKSADIKQAEHNFFEIANHLGFKDEEIEVIP